MEHPKVLIQLDTDALASVFDALVAIDSGVDHLLQYASVNPDNVTGLVHGAMFTRSPSQLSNTAIFVGGSSTQAGEALLSSIASTFFGPVRVSVMLDSNGSNTTAAAAVLCAARHLSLSTADPIVLGGTGPVGGRVARILYALGATVSLVSRDTDKAMQACQSIESQMESLRSSQSKGLAGNDSQKSQGDSQKPQGRLVAVGMNDSRLLRDRLSQASLVVACGAAGIQLVDESLLSQATNAKVCIDLNAVPPAGIHGINPTDKAVERHGRIEYGAIGVGGLKMKIHRAAVQALFQRNDQVLNVDEIYRIGEQLEAESPHSRSAPAS
jgi:methylenetetrahydrofolate/methylenetetrahydromethanopterin dehydrogenase (NADP+)